MLVMLGFTGCQPDEVEEEYRNGLPRCRPDVAYLMYGPPTCYWDSRATMPEWLEPSEAAVLFVDEIRTNEGE